MPTAFDIRAMQAEFEKELRDIVHEELLTNFSSYISPSEAEPLLKQILKVMLATLDTTTTMDAADRMIKVAASGDSVIVRHFTLPHGPGVVALSGLPQFNDGVAQRAATSLIALRKAYLTGARSSAPAIAHLTKTRPIYEFVRKTLGIRMHGLENHQSFPEGLDIEDATIGEDVSLIHEVSYCLDHHAFH
jgi:phenylalanine ammonia-lyase